MINDNDGRKKELKDKVKLLSKTVREIEKPRNRQETAAYIMRQIYMENIQSLKEFLVDRVSKGEKPRLIVESPYTYPETGLTEDRIYMPRTTEYHQEKLDMLKKQQLIPDDGSTIEDYGFLFEFKTQEKELKV